MLDNMEEKSDLQKRIFRPYNRVYERQIHSGLYKNMVIIARNRIPAIHDMFFELWNIYPQVGWWVFKLKTHIDKKKGLKTNEQK